MGARRLDWGKHDRDLEGRVQSDDIFYLIIIA